MENPKYQIFKGRDNQFYFRLRAGNGEIILGSEGYTRKQSCEDGIESVRKHSPFDRNYQRRNVTSTHFTFNLKASNGEIIGRSEKYNSESARENGIESVKENGPKSPVEDLTK